MTLFRFSKYVFGFILLFFTIIIFLPDATKMKNHHFSTMVLDENNEIIRIFLNDEDQWFLPLSEDFEIPYNLKSAVLEYEDRWFYYHPGVNIFSLYKAMISNIKAGKIVRGGSTITMQLIRVTNYRKRTYLNKMFEIFLALKIELKYSKEEIFKMYLERAPYGGNIIGIRAASLKYFGKEPNLLSWNEAAILAVLPNSPGLIFPGENHQKLINKKNNLLKRLNKKGKIDNVEYQLSSKEKVSKTQKRINQCGYHFADFVKNQSSKNIIKTTLNSNIQKKLEKIVSDYYPFINSDGIKNCSVIVINNSTHEIKAWIGSQNYFDKKNNGMVDGVLANRSSGSILKPFLYAASMDKGIILPETKLLDVPTFFGTYSPENANLNYLGMVSAKEALIKSLNIPAIRLEDSFSSENFYYLLKKMGISSLFREPEDYGLTLVVGGAEVNLFDLAKLYSGLANLGNFHEISYLKGSNSFEDNQLISKGASYLTVDILKNLTRRGEYKYWKQFTPDQYIAWKTGTSFGHRDAWACGVTPNWTVCVWTGNFTGESNPKLSGAKSSGTLMFRIFEVLDNNNNWFNIPKQELKIVTLCKESGYLAGEYCLEKIETFAPQNAPPLPICPYHKKIYIDAKSGYEVCSLCWEKNHTKEKIILDYPPVAQKYLKQRGIFIEQKPSHNPSCRAYHKEDKIKIIYPINNAEILIPKLSKNQYQNLVIQASHSNKNAILYWYLDNEFIGNTINFHTMKVNPNPGKHQVSIIDEEGNTTSVSFFIIKH